MIETIHQTDIQQDSKGEEKQCAFEIRCMLMSSPCSINDDLGRLQIEYSPLSESETEALLTSLTSLHFHSFCVNVGELKILHVFISGLCF